MPSKNLSVPPYRFKNEVNSQPPIYHMRVSRILLDHEYLVVYHNKANILYKTVKRRDQESPMEVTLHILDSNVGDAIIVIMVDDWGREYFIVCEQEYGTFTWQRIPLSQMGIPPISVEPS